MKKIIITASSMLLFLFSISAQLITSDPILPTDEDPTTIIFDASQGNAQLSGFTGDVYAHTGVITNLSISSSDWKHVIADWSVNTAKAKMISMGGNKFKLVISPSIREFYGVQAGETIKQLAFVFRNSDGSKQGKTSAGGDIFVDVVEAGLAVSIISPTTQPYFVEAGVNFDLKIDAKESTQVKILIDNVQKYATSDKAFTYVVTAAASGSHWIKVEATDGTKTEKDSMYYVVRSNSIVQPLPVGVHDGINYIDNNTVTLVLQAPYKKSAYVSGDFNNWEANSASMMNRTTASDTDPELRFWITLTGLTSGKEYIFQYLVDETLKIADPYSEKISDPWNDKYITTAVYPGLIAYPEGKTSGIASVFQTAQSNYSWQINNFTPPKVDDLVVYELLIRDFTANSNYQTMIDTIGYFKRLGINAIELMPVNEFEGNDSWGYNPAFYFAPDKAYGTKNKLKEFIDICHKNGIAVVIDMVLNHSFGLSPLVQLYFDANTGKTTAQNLWYNQTSPNQVYNWGYDFNHESKYTKQFVDSVNSYWLINYKVDGFRFDFTKGFTNTPGDGWAYDAPRITILKRMYDKIKVVNPNALVILEHLATNSEEQELSNYGMLLWGNMNGKYTEGAMGYNESDKSDLSGTSYLSRGWTKPNLVSYMESHDEERIMYKNITYGNASATYNIKALNTALPRIELDACFFFTIPGPKMIWQFGELGYDISIDNNGRTGKKPVKWEYYKENDRYRLFQVFSTLIKLKKENPVFETKDFTLDVKGTTKWINLNGTDMKVAVIGNFAVYPVDAEMKVQNTGTWYDYFSGTSIQVTDVNQKITLKPGEYHIYTTVQLTKPDVVADVEEIENNPGKTAKLKAFPNPASTNINIDFKLEEMAKNAEISIFNLSGQKVITLHKGQLNKGEQHFEWNLNNFQGQKVTAGAYLLKMESNNLNENKVLIVK